MICTKCNGDGIVGNGENPTAKEGEVKTCDVCTGTGQVADEATVSPEVAPEVSAEEVVAEPAPVADETPTSTEEPTPAE